MADKAECACSENYIDCVTTLRSEEHQGQAYWKVGNCLCAKLSRLVSVISWKTVTVTFYDLLFDIHQVVVSGPSEVEIAHLSNEET